MRLQGSIRNDSRQTGSFFEGGYTFGPSSCRVSTATTRVELASNTRSCLFTGLDGAQYRWALGAFGLHHPKVSIFFALLQSSALNYIMKLVTSGEKKTVIADPHPAHYLVKRQKA